jgi:hypothetical protein
LLQIRALNFVFPLGYATMKPNSAKRAIKSQSPSPEKAAGIRPRALAPISQNPVVPEEVRALLGPSWIIEGEDPELYEVLLARVGAAVEPADIIDWLLVKDVVALTWEIQRSRRHRDGLVRIGRCKAMEKLLELILPRENAFHSFSEESDTNRIATDWFNGDKKATKLVDAALAKAGLSFADVTAQSLSMNAAELDRLDQQNERRENRRDAILLQIERRRVGWAKRVQRASEDVVDAEFRENPPGGLDGPAIRQVSQDPR